MSDSYRKKYEENPKQQDELTKSAEKKNRRKPKIYFSKDSLLQINDGDTFKDDKSTGSKDSEGNRKQRGKCPSDEKKPTKSCMKPISLPSSTCDEHTSALEEDKDKKSTDDKEESPKDKYSLQRRKQIITPLLGKRGSQLIQLANSYNTVSSQIDSEEKKVELANLSRKEHEIARQNYEAACEAAQRAREEKTERVIREKEALLESERIEHAEQVKKAREELAKKEAEQKAIRQKIYEQALAKAEEEKAAREKRLALKRKREEDWARRLLQKGLPMQEHKHDLLLQTRPTQVDKESQNISKPRTQPSSRPIQADKGSQKISKQGSQPSSKETSQTQLSQTSSKEIPPMVLTPPEALLSLTNLEVVQLTSPKDEQSKESALAAVTSTVGSMKSAPEGSQQSVPTQSGILSPESLTSEQVKITPSKASRIRDSLRNAVRKVKREKFSRLSLERSVKPARSSSDAEGRLKPRRWPKFKKT